jgi:hypothetical protein
MMHFIVGRVERIVRLFFYLLSLVVVVITPSISDTTLNTFPQGNFLIPATSADTPMTNGTVGARFGFSAR